MAGPREKRDYSLTKDIDFSASKEIYNLSNDYVSMNVPGRFSKKAFSFFLKIYEGACGKHDTIEKVFSLVSSYNDIDVNDESYSFINESLQLKQIYIQLRNYEAELEEENYQLGRIIDEWLAKINPKTMSLEQKQKDIQFVAHVEMILNRRVFVHESKMYYDSMMKGSLADNYPFEEPVSDSIATSIELPVMTHIPIEDDIDKKELSSVNLMQVLYNIVSKDSYVIMNLFHDYDNGNVCVKLWKNDNGAYIPCFVTINKLNVYMDKVGDLEQKSIWPGLIEAAIKNLGCEDDKKAIAEAILGPEYSKYGEDYLSGPNNPAKEDIDAAEEFNELLYAYIKCVYDIYGAMLLTNSLVIEDEAPYVKLMFGVKELLYSLTSCMFRSFDIAADTITLLKKLKENYINSVKESGRLSDPIVNKRLSVCETLDELLYLLENDCDYHNNPRGYYESILAKQIAQIILESIHGETTPEAVKAKTQAVLSDTAFRKKVSKMNIHILKQSTPSMAAAVLDAMEGRSGNKLHR